MGRRSGRGDEVRRDAIHPGLRYGRRRGVILSLYARDRALLPQIAQLLQAGEAALAAGVRSNEGGGKRALLEVQTMMDASCDTGRYTVL